MSNSIQELSQFIEDRNRLKEAGAPTGVREIFCCTYDDEVASLSQKIHDHPRDYDKESLEVANQILANHLDVDAAQEYILKRYL